MKAMAMKKSIGTQVYTFFISLRLSVILLLLLTLDLCLGYLFLHGNASFYEPMNEVGLRRWLLTYGIGNPWLSGWFFILLFLLFFLAINTIFCTFDKLHHLFRSGIKSLRNRSIQRTLSIHLMHIAMVLLLTGYIISYTTATLYNSITIRAGGSHKLADTGITLQCTGMEPVPYTAGKNDSFSDRYIDAMVHMKFTSQSKSVEKTLSTNKPVSFKGYSFFLQNFNPRYKGGMSAVQYIVLDVRRDVGVRLTFFGMAAFIIGFLGYIRIQGRTDKNRRKK